MGKSHDVLSLTSDSTVMQLMPFLVHPALACLRGDRSLGKELGGNSAKSRKEKEIRKMAKNQNRLAGNRNIKCINESFESSTYIYRYFAFLITYLFIYIRTKCYHANMLLGFILYAHH